MWVIMSLYVWNDEKRKRENFTRREKNYFFNVNAGKVSFIFGMRIELFLLSVLLMRKFKKERNWVKWVMNDWNALLLQQVKSK